MIRYTTPRHNFYMEEISASALNKVRVTYAQNGNIVLEKTEADCSFDGNCVSVTLTQEDTAKFAAGSNVSIQLRVLTNSGASLATKVYTVEVDDVLNCEVL